MSVAGRRAELIRILRVRKKDTIENLARELCVSRSTIKRDLLILTVDEMYHIDTLPGNGGGVVFHDINNPHKGILSQEQIDVLTELVGCIGNHQSNVIKGILEAYA